MCQQYPCTESITPQLIGIKTIGALIDSDNSNYLNGAKVTTGVLGGQAVAMAVYVHGPLDVAARRGYQIGLYSDKNGFPDQLLGVSVEGTLQSNTWNSLTVAGVRLQPLTDYWVMANNSGQTLGTNRMVYEMGGGGVGAWSSLPVPFGTWPITFPSTLTTFRFSMTVTLVP